MDALAPPLKALLNIKLKIQTGASVREAVREFAREFIDCPFAKDLGEWLFQVESELEVDLQPFQKPYRKILIEILERGLQGDQILKDLSALEEELITASQEDLDKQLQKLPLITLLPLLFLQLPAFLILLLGPLILKLLLQLEA